MKCLACENESDAATFPVREMMFGTREAFDYQQCEACGSVQVAAIPDDLARHYPSAYFSFTSQEHLTRLGLRAWIDAARVSHALGKGSLVGMLASRLAKPLDYLPWVRRAEVDRDARILDVGCGAGRLLLRMKLGGFQHCTGVDPFLDQTIAYSNGVTVHKMELVALAESDAGPFDLVMFHHSFEHLVDPQQALDAATSLLAPGGTVLIRIPASDSLAFDIYREHWVGLDAPRHLFLPSARGMTACAGRAGLQVIHRDTKARRSQLVASELYKRDVPANAPKQGKDVFNASDLAAFDRQVDEAQRAERGAEATYYLRRKEGDG